MPSPLLIVPSARDHFTNVFNLGSGPDVLKNVDTAPMVAAVKQDLPPRHRAEEKPIGEDVGADNLPV